MAIIIIMYSMCLEFVYKLNYGHMSIFYVSWTVHFVNTEWPIKFIHSLLFILHVKVYTFFWATLYMRENQQMHQLFIQFINYVW
jgi:hypothetical protein